MTHLLKRLKKTLEALLQSGSGKRPGLSLREAGKWWPFLKPYRGLCFGILVLSLATSAISSILPLSTKFIIDGITQKTSLPGLSQMAWVGSGIFALVILFHFLNFLLQVLSFRLEQHFVIQLQMLLFKRVLRFPLAFFGRKTSNYLTQRILSDVEVAQNLLHMGSTQILTHAFRVLGCFLVLFQLSTLLTMAVGLAIPVFVVVSFFFASRALNLSWNEREKEARIGEEVQESFAGIETVKAFNTYSRQTKRLASRMKDGYVTRERELLAGLISHYAERLVQIVVFLVVSGLGIWEVFANRLTIGGLVAFFSNMGVLALSISELLQIHLLSQPYVASLQRIMRLLKKSGEGKKRALTGAGSGLKCDIQVPAASLQATNSPDSVARNGDSNGKSGCQSTDDLKILQTRPNQIHFSDVTFGYDPHRVVLQNLSFRVKKGEILALMGRSGIGKTTIAKLLQGFYQPQGGKILLDGILLSDLDPYEYRHKIGYVSQDMFLFRDTVFNNMRISCSDASQADIVRACEIAQIHRDIEKLPQGYETLIGERGATLSLGQRQRLSIARALVHQPPIFILDEPTSALDAKTEADLLTALKDVLKKGITIIISHKPSLAEWADKVITLKEA